MKKDLMKITACVFAAITLMTGTVTAAAAEIPMNNESGASETAERTEQTVIEEMICAYGSGGEQADAKADALLNELNDMDSRQGRLWNDIMDYWRYIDSDYTVNTEKLPDNLPKDNSMALTVLGYQLNADGSMQDELIRRLETALACAEQYPEAYVICSGGGTAKNNPEVTEGGQMAEWMLAHGLDESRLIVEDQSRNTAENANFVYNILRGQYPQVDSIAVISSSYHVARGSLLFESAFLECASRMQSPEIHVVSNCACFIDNDMYPAEEARRMEAFSMLQLIGSNQLAVNFLFGGSRPKPFA